MIYLVYMQAEFTEARSRVNPGDWVPLLRAHPELLIRYGGPNRNRGLSRREFLGNLISGGGVVLGSSILAATGFAIYRASKGDNSKNYPEIIEGLIKDGDLSGAFNATLVRYLSKDGNGEIWSYLKDTTPANLKIAEDKEKSGLKVIEYRFLKPDFGRGDAPLIRGFLKYNPLTGLLENQYLSFNVNKENRIASFVLSDSAPISPQIAFLRLNNILAGCPEAKDWINPQKGGGLVANTLTATNYLSLPGWNSLRLWTDEYKFNSGGMFELRGSDQAKQHP